MEIKIDESIERIVEIALAEDIGRGDVTTMATVPADSFSKALIVARENLSLCGLSVAEAVFKKVDETIKLTPLKHDGEQVLANSSIAVVEGRTMGLLTAERVALNFLQRLSGVATATGKFVEAVKGTKAKILDTRKTTPGLRKLEKYAVCCGGGVNHRIGLYDQILIKDNHLAALKNELPNPIAAAVKRSRERFPSLIVEVEADTLEQVAQAVEANADIILLDNMGVEQIREAVRIVNGRCKLEVSGGVNLSTVRAFAETGVDYISVGSITHSARAVDIALDFVE
ncbi:MAG: carboxylating nicotinate-nucleotide diphosphorylase [Verrucomicrobiae bacterium]|nr:carboxylating nicotinate-nucleotide diphosphorylase [Verrucomicrobiae bacterium]